MLYLKGIYLKRILAHYLFPCAKLNTIRLINISMSQTFLILLLLTDMFVQWKHLIHNCLI